MNNDTRVISTKSATSDLSDVRDEATRWIFNVLSSIDHGEKALQIERAAPIRIATFEVQ
jgi:hypothetical protein